MIEKKCLRLYKSLCVYSKRNIEQKSKYTKQQKQLKIRLLTSFACSRNHSFAEVALVIVSWVVNVWDKKRI